MYITILMSLRLLKSTWTYCLRSCEERPAAGAQYSSLCNPAPYGSWPTLWLSVWNTEETLSWLSLILPSVIPKGPKLSQSVEFKIWVIDLVWGQGWLDVGQPLFVCSYGPRRSRGPKKMGHLGVLQVLKTYNKGCSSRFYIMSFATIGNTLWVHYSSRNHKPYITWSPVLYRVIVDHNSVCKLRAHIFMLNAGKMLCFVV